MTRIIASQDASEGWADKTVAVTGAAGFLGNHLVEALLAAGAKVRALARYNSAGSAGGLGRIQDHERLEVHFGDVRSAATLAPVMAGADVVYHLAALVSVPHSYSDPAGYEQTNVLGSINVLDACRAHGVSRVVLTSSSEVYGTAQSDSIDEHHPLVAQSPYAATKIAMEKLGESYFRSYGTPVVIVRPFNLYGPGQSVRAVVPTIVAQALDSDVIRIGRTDSCRDFNYVSNTAAALVRIGAASGLDGHVFNIGSGHSVTIKQIIRLVGDLLGREFTTQTDERRVRPTTSEVTRLCADSTALRLAIGDWPATDLDVGLTHVIADMRTRAKPFVDWR